MSELPKGWKTVPFEEVVEVNPRKSVDLELDDIVTFVPMAAVSEVSGTIVNGVSRPLHEVNKGFTQFANGDVIFAKITPSMENGKSAVASGLENGIGFGSTEFHVLRSLGAVLPEYLWLFVRQKPFREDAQKAMSGAVGQQRVPAGYLKAQPLPLPPITEQKRIIARVESLTGYSARARTYLDRIPALFSRYRRTMLGTVFDQLGGQNPLVRLVDLTTKIGSGATPRGGRTVYVSEGTPLIRSQNIYFEGFKTDGLVFIDDGAADSLSGVEIQKNDVLLNITGASIGRACVVPEEYAGARVNQHVAIMRCSDRLKPQFLLYFLWSPQMQKLINDENYGVTRQALTKGMIENFEVPVPDLETQREIVRQIETSFAWLNKLAADHAAATELLPLLDAAVLSKAFCGELIPQDPNDEPATRLLERIRAEKETAGAERKRRLGNPPSRNPEKRKPTMTDLIAVLKSKGHWMLAAAAAHELGIGNGSTSDAVEEFYGDLRSRVLDGSIEVQRRGEEDWLRLRPGKVG